MVRGQDGAASRAIMSTKAVVDVSMVDYEAKVKLRKRGSGKITIDSGAGESVCPINMVLEEPLQSTAKNGTRYCAAGGQAPINKGEKRITLRSGKKVRRVELPGHQRDEEAISFGGKDCQ